MTGALSDDQIEGFVEAGFVRLRHVVPGDIVAAGQAVIWADLETSPDRTDSWPGPVARVVPSDPRPFKAAFDNPRLWTAFDQLVGTGRWQHRPDLGLFVVRFPHAQPPDDTGWHIDASFPPDDAEPTAGHLADYSHWRVNITSRGRALLMLFLYTDVGHDDAPTRIKVGSHLDAAPTLAPAGSAGVNVTEASALGDRASDSRPTALATGEAGDVYLCHPFLLHAAQAVRSTTPRVLSQPPLGLKEPLALDRPDADTAPVERAILRGLRRGTPR